MPRRELSLRPALEQWCDPVLVERVRSEERKLSEYELNQTSRVQLTPLTERTQPTSRSWMLDTDLTNWLAAWHALENDLRQRIGAVQFYITGVQAKPQRLTRREPLQAAWAADMKFDFAVGAITVDEYRYTAVTCSLDPPLAEPVAEFMPAAKPIAEAASIDLPIQDSVTALTDEQVAMLDAETVARLLERHAEQVIKSLTLNLLPPGKASPMALVATKMKNRAERGELLPALAKEADWLSAWATKVAPAYQIPKAKTIINKLRSLYQELRRTVGPVETRSPPKEISDGE
jgi:hypothetical protein